MDAFKWQNGGAFEAKGGRSGEPGENGSGESEETSTLRYCLVYSSPFFEIDSISGVITLKKSAEEIVAELGQYTTGLGVRIYESRMIDGQSGGVGSVWSDDASINVIISHWTVERKGNATAQAIASDGCSVDMRAKDCGLSIWSPQKMKEVFSGASPKYITHLATTPNLLPKTGERSFMKLFLFLSIRPFIRTELAVNKGRKLSLSHTNICL